MPGVWYFFLLRLWYPPHWQTLLNFGEIDGRREYSHDAAFFTWFLLFPWYLTFSRWNRVCAIDNFPYTICTFNKCFPSCQKVKVFIQKMNDSPSHPWEGEGPGNNTIISIENWGYSMTWLIRTKILNFF